MVELKDDSYGIYGGSNQIEISTYCPVYGSKLLLLKQIDDTEKAFDFCDNEVNEKLSKGYKIISKRNTGKGGSGRFWLDQRIHMYKDDMKKDWWDIHIQSMDKDILCFEYDARSGEPVTSEKTDDEKKNFYVAFLMKHCKEEVLKANPDQLK